MPNNKKPLHMKNKPYLTLKFKDYARTTKRLVTVLICRNYNTGTGNSVTLYIVMPRGVRQMVDIEDFVASWIIGEKLQ